jgi:phosphinothricin acetyltransferase
MLGGVSVSVRAVSRGRISIRIADPASDAAAVAAIYAPVVRETVISFEDAPPGVDEIRARMEHVLDWAPWLVAEVDGEVVGYAYAARHRERAAYRWSVDLSAYIAEAWRGKGVGRALYARVIEILRQQGFVNAYAGVTEPNPASIALHRAIGMEVIGTFERVGWKFDAWHGVTWLGMRLSEPDGQPAEPIPLPELRARLPLP